ncbi:MAG: molybdopterin-dependent oxidoreductase [Desulfobacterales bacterium]|nr:molybdopterin-dependent oxidoreductase [Desulfobacterales bacterium]
MTAAQSGKKENTKIVKTLCNMCTNHCGIDVHLNSAGIEKITGMKEHPFHRPCPKALAIPEMIYAKERVTTPLRKVNGAFQEIGWEEAFSFVVDRLTAIRKKFGAGAVVPFAGNGLACRSTPQIVKRFAQAFGSPNFISGAWTCFAARDMAFKLTVGSLPNADYSPDNKCMLLWGKNPQTSSAPEWQGVKTSLAGGAKLIVIDPVATPLAKKADIHARIRPGTDCALALGLLNVIIREDLYDKDFVNNWTIGFDKLVEHVRNFTPQKVADITWVPAETVTALARMYAAHKPASISVGVALEHCSNGIQTMRAIATLMAICGNLEISGGNLTFPSLKLKSMGLPDRVENTAPLGAEFPLFTENRKHTAGTRLTDAILTQKPYPIKAVLVIGGNPLVNWPNSEKVKRAFESLDFLLVQDLFITDTARIADIFLPAASDQETEDLRNTYFDHNGLPLIAKSNKVIEPVGDCMEDWKILCEIGRRMGYTKYFPWKTADELNAELLEPTPFSLEDLNKQPGGTLFRQRELQTYLRDGFKTDSKKVEIYSEKMARLGYDPLPTFHEPVESPVSRPDLAKQYPYVLMTGARTKGYTHSRFRQLESLKNLYPDPLVELNTQTARRLGIRTGQAVTLESPRGSIQAAAHLTESIHPGVVAILSGWSRDSGGSANSLTDDMAVDPVSGFPEFRALLCNIKAGVSVEG